jgi:hypothetical protein
MVCSNALPTHDDEAVRRRPMEARGTPWLNHAGIDFAGRGVHLVDDLVALVAKTWDVLANWGLANSCKTQVALHGGGRRKRCGFGSSVLTLTGPVRDREYLQLRDVSQFSSPGKPFFFCDTLTGYWSSEPDLLFLW